jgi:hypothetical protein
MYIWFLFLFNNVIYVFLLLCLRILIVCLCIPTLTEGFPCFFLSCKANARVKPAKTGHGPHSCFVSFSVLLVYVCVLYYCHRVATQLQLKYIIYHFVNLITIAPPTTHCAGSKGLVLINFACNRNADVGQKLELLPAHVGET